MSFDLCSVLAGDDTVLSLCRGLKGYQEGYQFETDFSLRGISFMNVGVIGGLAMFMKWSRERAGKACRFSFDRNSNLCSYLERINFFRILGVDVDEHFERHASERFMELAEIIDDDDYTANEIPSKLRQIVSKTTRIDITLESALDLAFGEVIDNVLTHSETTVPGLAIAQYYPKKGYVEFCVADAGIGIPASLAKNVAYRSEPPDRLLLEAFKNGVGENVMGLAGGLKGYGAGYGLAFTSRLVNKTGGKLWAISHDSALEIGVGTTRLLDDCWFPGTLICARVKDDVTLSEKDLDVNGKADVDQPFYWDHQGNDLEDLFDGDVLW